MAHTSPALRAAAFGVLALAALGAALAVDVEVLLWLLVLSGLPWSITVIGGAYYDWPFWLLLLGAALCTAVNVALLGGLTAAGRAVVRRVRR